MASLFVHAAVLSLLATAYSDSDVVLSLTTSACKISYCVTMNLTVKDTDGICSGACVRVDGSNTDETGTVSSVSMSMKMMARDSLKFELYQGNACGTRFYELTPHSSHQSAMLEDGHAAYVKTSWASNEAMGATQKMQIRNGCATTGTTGTPANSDSAGTTAPEDGTAADTGTNNGTSNGNATATTSPPMASNGPRSTSSILPLAALMMMVYSHSA